MQTGSPDVSLSGKMAIRIPLDVLQYGEIERTTADTLIKTR